MSGALGKATCSIAEAGPRETAVTRASSTSEQVQSNGIRGGDFLSLFCLSHFYIRHFTSCQLVAVPTQLTSPWPEPRDLPRKLAVPCNNTHARAIRKHIKGTCRAMFGMPTTALPSATYHRGLLLSFHQLKNSRATEHGRHEQPGRTAPS